MATAAPSNKEYDRPFTATYQVYRTCVVKTKISKQKNLGWDSFKGTPPPTQKI